MFIEIELAIAMIALALFVLLAAVIACYIWIGREQREIERISEKIERTEVSIKKINGSFITLKS